MTEPCFSQSVGRSVGRTANERKRESAGDGDEEEEGRESLASLPYERPLLPAIQPVASLVTDGGQGHS